MSVRELANEYLDLIEQEFRPHTFLAYRDTLVKDREQGADENGKPRMSFCMFLEQQQPPIKDPKEVKPKTVRDFLTHLEGASDSEKGLSQRSIRRHRSTVSSFFKFLREKGEITTNPVKQLHSPRRTQRAASWMELEEVEALLDAPVVTEPADHRDRAELSKRERALLAVGKRDRALLAMMYSAGTRASEIVALNVNELDLDRGRAKVFGKGKGGEGLEGGKERFVFLGPRAQDALRAYLDEPERKPRPGQKREPVFLNLRGERLTTRSVCRIVEKHARAANLKRRVTPHTIRHSFANHLLRDKPLGEGRASLQEVKVMLGHEDVTTTQTYAHLSDDDVLKDHAQGHPVG